jgi:hypothetical protein
MTRLGISLAIVLALCAATARAGERRVVTGALPELRDTGLPPFTAEVHLAGVALSEDDAPVTVRIAEGTTPMVLVLQSLSEVDWRLSGAVQRLQAVMVINQDPSHRSVLSGVPEGIPLYQPSNSYRRAPLGHWPCPPTAPVSAGGQCLDPALRIRQEHLDSVPWLSPTGVVSYNLAWRTRHLEVPGRREAALSLAEARDLVAQLQTQQPGRKPLSVLAERLARLGDHPGLAVGSGGGHELHLVDVGPCLANRPCERQQRVAIAPSGRPIILALRGNRDLEWLVEPDYGARLAGVVLMGDTLPVALHAPPEVPVAVLTKDLALGRDSLRRVITPSADTRPDDIGAWERFERYLGDGRPVTLR